MKKISILGTGVMGTAIAMAYLKAGYPTTVWNRTKSKTLSLVNSGATLAETVEEAIQQGDIVISSLSTYEDLTDILLPIKSTWKAKVLVNISSGTSIQARDFGRIAIEKEIPYLDSAAMSGVKLVGHKDGFFLFSGAESEFINAKPSLEVLGNANYLGEDYGLTPLYDTALFTLAWGSLMGFYHAAALLNAESQDLSKLANIAKLQTAYLAILFKEHSNAISTGIYNNDDGNIDIHLSAMDHVKTISKESNVSDHFPSFIINILSKAKTMGHGDNGIASAIEVFKNNG